MVASFRSFPDSVETRLTFKSLRRLVLKNIISLSSNQKSIGDQVQNKNISCKNCKTRRLEKLYTTMGVQIENFQIDSLLLGVAASSGEDEDPKVHFAAAAPSLDGPLMMQIGLFSSHFNLLIANPFFSHLIKVVTEIRALPIKNPYGVQRIIMS